MKLLMSNNYKINVGTAHDLVETVKKYPSVDGFEIYVKYHDDKEIKFLKDLVFECSKNNLWFQVHGDSSESIDSQKNFLKMLDEESNLLNYPIKVVLHPLVSKSIDESICSSNLYFGEVLKFVSDNNLNVRISIENLNSLNTLKRLNIFEIEKILCNNETLFFTYDIGHALIEYEDVTEVSEVELERIDNIHLHSFVKDIDHHPICKENHLSITKAINFIKYIKYDKTIILEYDFYQVIGDNYNDKLNNYLHSFDFIKQFF